MSKPKKVCQQGSDSTNKPLTCNPTYYIYIYVYILYIYIYVIYIPWLRGVYSPYTPRSHGIYNIFYSLMDGYVSTSND